MQKKKKSFCTSTLRGKKSMKFFMTAGILMLLLLIDGLLLDYDHRRRGRKQAEEIMKGLKDEETDEEKQ